jgi:hypothetical protein
MSKRITLRDDELDLVVEGCCIDAMDDEVIDVARLIGLELNPRYTPVHEKKLESVQPRQYVLVVIA